MEITTNDIIFHSGVKGMKWGKKKPKKSSTKKKKLNKKTAMDKANDAYAHVSDVAHKPYINAAVRAAALVKLYSALGAYSNPKYKNKGTAENTIQHMGVAGMHWGTKRGEVIAARAKHSHSTNGPTKAGTGELLVSGMKNIARHPVIGITSPTTMKKIQWHNADKHVAYKRRANDIRNAYTKSLAKGNDVNKSKIAFYAAKKASKAQYLKEKI